eukprot:2515810-Rhodomonas_salina.2
MHRTSVPGHYAATRTVRSTAKAYGCRRIPLASRHQYHASHSSTAHISTPSRIASAWHNRTSKAYYIRVSPNSLAHVSTGTSIAQKGILVPASVLPTESIENG